MERKIYINDTASNRVVTLTTSATTFGEVKNAAIAAGINVSGKDWLEGITKTSPQADDAILPSNVTYKGSVTNDLVFILTNTNKNIQSGMSIRADLYKKINELGLKEQVKEYFGKPYTNVTTDDLDIFLSDYEEDDVEEVHSEECAQAHVNSDKYKSLIHAFARFLVDMEEHQWAKDVTEEMKAIVEAQPASLNLSEEDVRNIVG